MLKPKTLKQLKGNLYFKLGDCDNTVSLVFRIYYIFFNENYKLIF